MGLMEIDLYFKQEWNFVFGLVFYVDKVGVSLIYRLQDEKLMEVNFNLCLFWLLKICLYEIGYMFGLYYCVEVNCVMNGINSLLEMDRNLI